jgi:hypothetical protein
MANRYFLNIGANWGDTANWSDTSGGTGGFSVPTNVDDVFFDANSGNCTVNASARTAKTLNFTGYTNTITMSNTITVSGNVTLGAGMGIAGASALIVDETSTLTSNGKTWSAPFTFSGTSKTFTLGDNWAISGQVNLSGTTATTINSNTLTSSGNLTSTTSATTSGTTNISLTGGTWSNSSTGVLRNNLAFTSGTITVSGTVRYDTNTLTYTAGTVTTSGSTLAIAASTTLNTSGITWNNLTWGTGGNITITLLSDINISGTLNNNNNNTINGSFNINNTGTITLPGSLSGTSTLNMLGGTINATTGAININLILNGNITLSNFTFSTNTLTYTSGNITLSSNHTLTIGSGTINTNTILWNNVSFTGGNVVYTSDFNVGGLISIANNFTMTGAQYNVNAYNGISVGAGEILNNINSVTLNLLGGTWRNTSLVFDGKIHIPTKINGNINIVGNVFFDTNTLTYVNGFVNAKNATLNILTNTTLVNIDKVNFNRVIITSGQTLTMNRFFNGTASIPTRVQCATATATYTVAFQDTFEKIANNVKISGCTLSRPGQLIVNGANSNKGNNTGIRFGNQSPNGLPKNTPTIKTETIFGIGNISEPTMVIS